MNMVLNDVCEVYSGYALKSFNEGKEGFPVIKIGNILTDGRLSLEDCQYTTETVNTKYYSQKDDVYVALSGATTGKIGLMETDESYVINQRVGVVRRKDKKIPSRFIKYFLLKQTERILQEAAGCAQPNISPKQIGAYTFPSFSSEKMEEITRELDKVTNVIQYRYKQNNLLDCLIKARFVEMFGALNNTSYETLPLGDICEFIKDGTHQTPTYTEDKVRGYKFLSSKDVTSQEISWSNIKYIPESLHNELYSKLDPRRGDILLAKNGTTGVAAVVDTDEVFDIYVSLALLRPKVGYNSRYLWAVINSNDTKMQFNANLKGIGVPNLHLGEIKKAKVIVPPLEQQEKFAVFLEQIDKSKVAIQKSLAETQLLFDKLMQDYFG